MKRIPLHVSRFTIYRRGSLIINNAPLTFPSLLKSYRGKIAAILALLLAVNLLTLVLPWAIKVIIDDILAARDARSLDLVILALAGVVCARAALSFLRFYLASVLGERIVRDLRRAVYGHWPRLSLLSVHKIAPAQILTRLTQDVDSVRRFLFGDAVESIYAFLNIGFIAAVLFWINGKLTAAALLTLPLFAAVYFRRLPRLKEAHRRLRELYGAFSARAGEVLNGIRVVRAFGKFDDEREGLDRRQDGILAVASKMHSVNAWLWAAIELFASLGGGGRLVDRRARLPGRADDRGGAGRLLHLSGDAVCAGHPGRGGQRLLSGGAGVLKPRQRSHARRR